jgi:hypothetical protein
LTRGFLSIAAVQPQQAAGEEVAEFLEVWREVGIVRWGMGRDRGTHEQPPRTISMGDR